MEKLSSVMDIDSLADEFASKIQNPAILAKCFSNNKCNLLHSAFTFSNTDLSNFDIFHTTFYIYLSTNVEYVLYHVDTW